MKHIIYIVIILFSFFSYAEEHKGDASESPSTANTTDQVFSLVKPLVFQVKTATDAFASKASYGSGFVVDTDGLLITNYHVVSTILQDEDKKYKPYVVIDKKPFEAEILDFSVIHDLALIKIKKTFTRALELQVESPKHGEKIYSIGLPEDLNMSIVEGNYNGIVKNGIYEKVYMSTPLNAGMSGGPTVNQSGTVVGVNVSIKLYTQNISFSVPASKAFNLIENYRASNSESSSLSIDKKVEKQLLIINNSLLERIDKHKNKTSTLLNWTFNAPSKTLKCWRSKNVEEKKYYEWINEYCTLEDVAYIEKGVYGGAYEISYEVFRNLKLNNIQFFNVANRFLIGESSRIYSKKKVYTAYSCEDNIIVNKNGVPFKVAFCINSFVKYDTIYNMNVTAVSLLKEDTIFKFTANLNGFSIETMKKFLRNQLDSIERL